LPAQKKKTAREATTQTAAFLKVGACEGLLWRILVVDFKLQHAVVCT